jgi:hypothetical protein
MKTETALANLDATVRAMAIRQIARQTERRARFEAEGDIVRAERCAASIAKYRAYLAH